MANQTSRAVMSWMQKHPGEIHHYNDIRFAIATEGLDVSPPAIAAVLAKLVKKYPERGITRTGAGLYMFRVADQRAPAPVEPEKRAPMMYEEVGITQAGDVVVRDEKGMLWKLNGAL